MQQSLDNVVLNKVLIIITVLLCNLLQAQEIDKILANLTSPLQKADTLQHLGYGYHMRAKPDSAEYFYKKALEFAQAAGDNSRIITLYTQLSRINTMQRRPDEALSSMRQVKNYINSATPFQILENYYFTIGHCFRRISQYDSALYYFQKAEPINMANNPYRNWYIYDGMAEVFLEGDNLDKAELYYLKAYSLTKKAAVRMDHGMMINRLGNLYVKKNDPVKFADILKEYEAFVKTGKTDFRKDPVHSLLYLNWENASLSQKTGFLIAVKDVHIQNNFSQGAALANYHIAALYESSDEPEKALKFLYENRDKYTNAGNLEAQYQNLRYIYKLETATGKYAGALTTANQLFELNTKINNIASAELAVELEKKYETEKKEKEIALLNSRNELASLSLLRANELKQFLESENNLKDSSLISQQQLAIASKREAQLKTSELENEKRMRSYLHRENALNEKLLKEDKNRTTMLWIGLSLLTVAGCIIFYQYRKQVAKNKIINQQREHLEVLNREIHHRVKNNLQVISSLLELQGENSTDHATAEKFQEGSQRVQSMAYIHQNLYQGNNPESIDVQQYVTMLTENLFQSYNADASNIELVTEVEALKLHSDTVIPLGMIINELVTNSLKHAFVNKKQGEIFISLKKKDEELLLRVKDNGGGIPRGFDMQHTNSFGYKIIKAFTQKLKALMSVNSDNGTDVQFVISKFRIS